MIKTTDRTYVLSSTSRTVTQFGVETVSTSTQRRPQSGTRTTANSPRWRERIKKGLNATGFLNGTDVVVKKSPASTIRYLKVSGGDGLLKQYFNGDPLELDPYYPGSVSSPYVTSADSTALSQIVSEVRKAQTKIQSIVSAGEAAKTAKALADSGKQLQSGVFALVWDNYRRLKREPPATRRKHWKAIVSDLWLTYVYGVQPLLSDIKGLAKANALTGAKTNPRIIVQGTGQSTSYTTWAKHTLGLNGVTVEAESRREVFADCKYVACVKATTPVGSSASLHGYDWSNVLPSVWELIPYSFVADYFTNLGEIISAVSLNQASIGWVYRTHRYGGTHSVLSSCDVTLNGPGDSSTYSPFSFSIETRSVDRRAIDSLPVPGLAFSLPGTKPWVNMLALGVSHNRALNRLR